MNIEEVIGKRDSPVRTHLGSILGVSQAMLYNGRIILPSTFPRTGHVHDLEVMAPTQDNAQSNAAHVEGNGRRFERSPLVLQAYSSTIQIH